MSNIPGYAEWRSTVKACTRCGLCETRTQVVVSRHADPQAEIKVFLLGEAPGGNEDIEGIPFCGQAGKILDEFLEQTGLKDEELYIGNTVKCRPTAPSARGRYGDYKNRKPKAGEIKSCSQWLDEELELVKPKLLVTLGNVPLTRILGPGHKIGDHHGKLFTDEKTGLKVFPLYHPAALIYDRKKTADYEADIKTLRELIATL